MGKVYDLEERTELFAKNCRSLVRSIAKDIGNTEDSIQLVRSSGSVAANYIEANEAISKKDCVFRVKISRKESKESRLWLKLLYINDTGQNDQRIGLVNEASELIKIFNAILSKLPPS
jgi:four helix bundle protein